VKKENPVITHIAVAFTGLSFLMFLITGILRQNSMIILMGIITLMAVVFYVSDFIKRKRERETNNK
jgi:predicted membrane-bound mannosyltransferase